MNCWNPVEEHIGRDLHEEQPQEALEVLQSVVRVLQAISVKKPFVDCCFSFQSVPQSWSSLVSPIH